LIIFKEIKENDSMFI